MKKEILTIALLGMAAAGAQAQWLRVWQAGESTRYALSEVAAMPYATAGSTLTIGEDEYATSEIDSLTIINPITVTWTADGASVDIPESVEGVTARIDGGRVIIDNVNTWAEQELILKGEGKGALTYNGDYKCKVHLNGLTLESDTVAALDIECGKRVDLILENGTVNALSDGTGGNQKAALYCRGHLEVSGSGSLTLQGNSKHALSSKEYLLLKKDVGSITITGAASDGIHVGEYLQMNGGTLALSGLTGDGIQVETDAKSDEELNGQFIMKGGSIQVTMSTADTKGIRLDLDSLDLSIVPQMNLLGGTIVVTMEKTATDSKGIVSDGDMTIGTSTEGPEITVNMNAVGYLDANKEKIRSTGIKVGKSDDDGEYGETGDFLMQGGSVVIYATGHYSRGMNMNNFIATGGSIAVVASLTGKSIQGIKYSGTTSGESYVKMTNCNWKRPE